MENHGLHDACNRLPLLCSYAIFGVSFFHALQKRYSSKVFYYIAVHLYMANLRLLFSLKANEMAKIRLLVIWKDQKKSFKIAKKIL